MCNPDYTHISLDLPLYRPVKWQVEGDVGVVRVTHFISSSDHALERALQEIWSRSNNRVRGLVLDLRNNPGGLLNQSVAVADAFLEQGEIVSVRNRALLRTDTISPCSKKASATATD